MQRMRLLLAAAFVLTALFSLMNVHAYTSAAVSGRLSLKVRTSANAALAVGKGNGSGSFQATQLRGMVVVDFRLGYGGPWGLQPVRTPTGFSKPLVGDRLRMKQVLSITNRSGSCQSVTITAPDGVPNLAAIYAQPAVGSSVQMTGPNGRTALGSITLGTTSTTNTMSVDFEWSPDNYSPANPGGRFQLEVKSQQTSACP